jgi:hypothetical protein
MGHQEAFCPAGLPGIWVVIGPGFGNFRVFERFFENFFGNEILPASGCPQGIEEACETRAIPRIVHSSAPFCSLSQSCHHCHSAHL